LGWTLCAQPFITTEWSDHHKETLFGAAVCVYWDPFFTGVAGGAPSPIGGAGGSAAHRRLRQQLLRALLSNPKCRDHFGGLGNALASLFNTQYADYSPGMSDPAPSIIPQQQWKADAASLSKTNAYARTYYLPGPVGATILKPSFYRLDSGFASYSRDWTQMTIGLHELEHVANQNNLMDNDYGSDYKSLNEDCLPQDIPVETPEATANLTGSQEP